MDKNSEPDAELDAGLELDQIDLSSLNMPSGSPAGRVPETVPGIREESENESRPTKNSITAVCFVAAILLLFTATFFFLKKPEILFSFSQNSNNALTSGGYASVGPFTTGVGNGSSDKIRIKLEIKCKTSELKDKIAKNKAVITNRLIISLSSREAGQFITSRDYPALKRLLVNALRDLLKDDNIEAILFSDLIIH